MPTGTWTVVEERAPPAPPRPVRRLTARVLDLLIASVPVAVVLVRLFSLDEDGLDVLSELFLLGALAVLWVLVGCTVAEALCLRRFGGTPGKLLVGIQVLDVGGRSIGRAQAWSRSLLVVTPVAVATCFAIPLLLVLPYHVWLAQGLFAGPGGRTWVDRQTQTVVVDRVSPFRSLAPDPGPANRPSPARVLVRILVGSALALGLLAAYLGLAATDARWLAIGLAPVPIVVVGALWGRYPGRWPACGAAAIGALALVVAVVAAGPSTGELSDRLVSELQDAGFVPLAVGDPRCRLYGCRGHVELTGRRTLAEARRAVEAGADGAGLESERSDFGSPVGTHVFDVHADGRRQLLVVIEDGRDPDATVGPGEVVVQISGVPRRF